MTLLCRLWSTETVCKSVKWNELAMWHLQRKLSSSHFLCEDCGRNDRQHSYQFQFTTKISVCFSQKANILLQKTWNMVKKKLGEPLSMMLLEDFLVIFEAWQSLAPITTQPFVLHRRKKVIQVLEQCEAEHMMTTFSFLCELSI